MVEIVGPMDDDGMRGSESVGFVSGCLEVVGGLVVILSNCSDKESARESSGDSEKSKLGSVYFWRSFCSLASR